MVGIAVGEGGVLWVMPQQTEAENRYCVRSVDETQMLKGPGVGREGAGLRLWQKEDHFQRGSDSHALVNCHFRRMQAWYCQVFQN